MTAPTPDVQAVVELTDREQIANILTESAVDDLELTLRVAAESTAELEPVLEEIASSPAPSEPDEADSGSLQGIFTADPEDSLDEETNGESTGLDVLYGEDDQDDVDEPAEPAAPRRTLGREISSLESFGVDRYTELFDQHPAEGTNDFRVLAVLYRAREPLTLQEVVDAFSRCAWDLEYNTASATLSTLNKNGWLNKEGNWRGQYELTDRARAWMYHFVKNASEYPLTQADHAVGKHPFPEKAPA